MKSLDRRIVNNGLNEYSFDITTVDAGDYLLIIKVDKENIIDRITVVPH